MVKYFGTFVLKLLFLRCRLPNIVVAENQLGIVLVLYFVNRFDSLSFFSKVRVKTHFPSKPRSFIIDISLIRFSEERGTRASSVSSFRFDVRLSGRLVV